MQGLELHAWKFDDTRAFGRDPGSGARLSSSPARRPAEPTLAAASPDEVAQGSEVVPVVADLDGAVVGRDQQRRLGREGVEEAADELVREAELASQVRAA